MSLPEVGSIWIIPGGECRIVTGWERRKSNGQHYVSWRLFPRNKKTKVSHINTWNDWGKGRAVQVGRQKRTYREGGIVEWSTEFIQASPGSRLATRLAEVIRRTQGPIALAS